MSSKTKKNFNSCGDFFDLVTTCHVLAAAMENLKMESADDEPSENVVPDACNVWTKPQDQPNTYWMLFADQLLISTFHFHLKIPSNPATIRCIS